MNQRPSRMRVVSERSIHRNSVPRQTLGADIAFRLARFARPLVDRFHYNALTRRHPLDTSSFPTHRNPYQTDVPYRTLLTWSFPLGVFGAAGAGDYVAAHFYSSIFFPKAKRSGGTTAMVPRLLPAYTLDTYSHLGLLEGESYDEMLEIDDPVWIRGFLRDSVSDGWYVSANANKYYIPDSDWWLEHDYRHPVLAMSLTREGALCGVITYTKDGSYREVPVPIDTLARAIGSRATFERFTRNDSRNSIRRLRRFRLAPEPLPGSDPVAIADQMSDYLASRCPPKALNNPNPDIEEFDPPREVVEGSVFGIGAMPVFTTYFRDHLARPKDFDPRVSRVLWEHKKMLVGRLRYLESKALIQAQAGLAAEAAQVSSWAQSVHLAMVSLLRDPSRMGPAELLLGSAEAMAAREGDLLGRARDALLRAG